MAMRRRTETKAVTPMRRLRFASINLDTSRVSSRKKKKKVRLLNSEAYIEAFSCDFKAGFSQNPQDSHVLLQKRRGPHMALNGLGKQIQPPSAGSVG